jgi:hypothetical protein
MGFRNQSLGSMAQSTGNLIHSRNFESKTEDQDFLPIVGKAVSYLQASE